MCTQSLFLVSYKWRSAFLVNILQKWLDNRAFIHRYIKHPTWKSFRRCKGKICNLWNNVAVWTFHLDNVIMRTVFSAIFFCNTNKLLNTVVRFVPHTILQYSVNWIHSEISRVVWKFGAQPRTEYGLSHTSTYAPVTCHAWLTGNTSEPTSLMDIDRYNERYRSVSVRITTTWWRRSFLITRFSDDVVRNACRALLHSASAWSPLVQGLSFSEPVLGIIQAF